MGFRQPKSDQHQRLREWQIWIDRCRKEIVSIGLPAEVYLNEEKWQDFLENGCLDHHVSYGFEFCQLSNVQLGALHRFLEREYGRFDRGPRLLEWLRIRSRDVGSKPLSSG